jgi:hypothetical protein
MCSDVLGENDNAIRTAANRFDIGVLTDGGREINRKATFEGFCDHSGLEKREKAAQPED